MCVRVRARVRVSQDCLRKFDEERGGGDEGEGDQSSTNDPYTLLVLGDSEAGKWTLANHLRKSSGKKTFPKKLPGVPLSYTYVAIEDEDGPAEGYRMNTWVLDKTDALPRFFTTALAASGGFGQGQPKEEGVEEDESGADGATPEPEAVEEVVQGREHATAAIANPALLAPMLERSVAIVCVDLSKPWSVAESLQRWVQSVSDETKAVIAQIDAVDKKAASRVRATLKERVHKAAYTQPGAEGEEASTAVQRLAGDAMQELGSTYEGVPLIVVPCKSDEINDWPAKLNFEDAHIDYVKAHLRKICLACGAGLVYTSAKQDTNIDKLRTYLLSRMVPGKSPPALNDEESALDQTATFVPAGTDTVKKIDSLLEVIFGTHHPRQPMALTGRTTMYPKLEQYIVSEIKRLAREDPELQQSYENDGVVTTAAAVSGIKNWIAHCIDGSVTKESVPDSLTAEVRRVLGVGLATEDKGRYVPMAPAEAAEHDKAINVEEFFLKLRGAAKEIDAFSWVVMDPNLRPKPLQTRMEVVDDQVLSPSPCLALLPSFPYRVEMVVI